MQLTSKPYNSAAKNFPYQIVDAHHHLWDLTKVNYPWLSAKGVPRFFGDPTPIQRDYLPSDLRDDIGELPVIKSVHIEVGAAQGEHFLESQTIQNMADNATTAQGTLADGIVAFAALHDNNIDQQLEKLSQLTNLRGIRQIVGRSPDEDKVSGTGSLVNDINWLSGLTLLSERDLSFDLQLIPDQMQHVADVLAHVPNLKIALCHCGSPWYRDKSGWAMWQQGLERLAALPNSMCKISGLSMFDHNWSIPSLQPIIDHVIHVFGAQRVMFGSNFPVDKLHTNYARLWQAYLDIVEQNSALTTADKQAMFAGNAIRFYSL